MQNQFFQIRWPDQCDHHQSDHYQGDALWRYEHVDGRSHDIAPPRFELDGHTFTAHLDGARQVAVQTLPHGVTRHLWRGAVRGQPEGLELEICFEISPDNPIARFRYTLHSQSVHRLTKVAAREALTYLQLDLSDVPLATEVRISGFRENVHSFCLAEIPLGEGDFANQVAVMGPILAASDGNYSFLAAYEHGSQAPDAFLKFHLNTARQVARCAVKGNYFSGQIVAPDAPFETIWLEFGAVAGDGNELARAYRDFALRYLSPNRESRQPYIFYDTWNFQERNQAWHGQPYLGAMDETRMLAEIEVAHRMGIEVFVIDTGWHQKTGDWQADLQRFPGAMKNIKAKLDEYGMKLGLWFDPCTAALSSQMLADHRDCV